VLASFVAAIQFSGMWSIDDTCLLFDIYSLFRCVFVFMVHGNLYLGFFEFLNFECYHSFSGLQVEPLY